MRAISDGHIDDGSGGFKKNFRRTQDFLDDAGKDPILWLGDTVELWKFKWYQVLGGPYRSLLDRMAERTQDVFVIGNHDFGFESLSAFFPRSNILPRMKIGNREIFHGFQVDPLLDSAAERWFVSVFDYLMTEISHLNDIRDQIADSTRTNDPLIESLLKAENKGKRFLLGHSHVEIDMGWFTNTGSLIGDRFPWVEVEDNGDCTLKYFGE